MLCRLCLKESECCLEIFDFNGEELEIADILKRHFWFQPLPDDSISTVICRICWLKVSDFHEFYLTVEQAQSLLSDNDLWLETVKVDEKPEFIENSGPIKEEFSENLSQTEEILDAVNPLDESELENDETEVSPENGLQSENIKADSNGKLQIADYITQNTRKPVQKRKYVRRKPPRKTPPEVKEDDEDSETENDDGDDVQDKPKLKKVVTSSMQDDAMVKKYISMGCELCVFVGEDFTAMSKHFRIQHPNIKPYIRCCNKKFNKRINIVQHAYKHEDPEFFKCLECLKIFSGRRTLRLHMIATHAPEEELNFACDQCPRKFPRKRLLDLHRPSHVPRSECTFLCDQCPNSRFASNHLLKIHICMRHRRATNVCHVCAKEIRSKASFEKHVRSHFGDNVPRVKCPRPDCDSWLKDAENLRQHLSRHNDTGQLYTCKECGRIYKNRQALRSHVHYVHSTEVFKCEECDKTFKKAITLREHIAQHTGESLYKCPFCTRTFNSNANMHSHKKKMHPVEWNIWRSEKQGSSQQLISEQQSHK